MGKNNALEFGEERVTCDEFLWWVKSDFDYLFEEYHFEVVHIDRAVTRIDYCLVILESSYCRMKFYRTYHEANVMVGTLFAPLSWEDGTGNAQSWFYLRYVLDFVSQRKPSLENLLADIEFRPVSQQLKELAEDLRPLCSKIMRLFQNQNTQDGGLSFLDFIQWRQDLGHKIQEQIQKRYSIASNYSRFADI